ncbi:ABC transporter substrate-binding protein [Rhodococcus sp. 114MFTsu3.1]|uniref:ABC transporter substrate-binding protein n=1 Tax=Rhodococcus sp. 114MFTsu3.1 TaxID=1172184 RepID=UPI00037EF144|nr:ABC transporter substrate-binding protein [Rhodococcus sp. 114MFTsu3.1]
MISRRGFLTGTAGGATALLLAACSSAVEEAKSGSGEAGGTLVIGSLSDLNPATIFSQSLTSMTIGGLVFDTLVRLDPDTLEPTPRVATSWEVSDDGLTVTLQLRDDVTFHSGRPFTSKDVEYAFTNLAKDTAGSQLQAAARTIEAVDTSDDHVAVLTLTHPLVNLHDLLEFALLTDSDTEAALLAGEQFVGTGPFVFDSWQRGRQSDWSRNGSYWDAPALLDKVTIRVVPDNSALLSSVRSGQTNAVIGVSAQDARPFSGDGYQVENEDVFDVAYYIGANVADPALADKRIRQAISYAVDRERILDEVLGGVGIASSAPWPESSPAYDEAARDFYSRDLDKARQLLADAGGPPSQPVLLSYGTGLAPARNIAAIIENNLADIGFTVTLDPREQATLSPFLNSGQHQLWINPHGFAQLNPSTLATGAAPFKPAKNLSGYTSPEYTAIVDRLWTQADPESDTAAASYTEFSDLLLDEQFVIDLAITTNTNVYSAGVSGIEWNRYKNLILNRATV